MDPHGARAWTGKWQARDFTLGESIGKGGMSVVHRAVHNPSGGAHAIKIVSPHTAQDRELLEREIDLSLRIVSPCVIRTYGSEKVGDDFWIFMELFEGQSLKTVLRDFIVNKVRYPFYDLRKYLGLFRALAVGLQAIHAAGVVHCDVKPENVLIGNGEFRLHDFGIAREELSAPPEVSGTVTYIAPEQIKREPVDRRTDLYALGVTMWELAMGMPPFVPPALQPIQEGLHRAGLGADERWDLFGKMLEARAMGAAVAADSQAVKADLLAILEHHLKTRPQIPGSFPYPEATARVLMKCLEKDKRMRWAKAQDLINELEKLTEASMQLPKSAASAPPAKPALDPSRVNRLKARIAQMRAASEKVDEDPDIELEKPSAPGGA